MSKLRLLSGAFLASAAIIGLGVATAVAADDDFMKMAKDYIAQATAPVTAWDGPTSGPKSVGKKLVIYVSSQQTNGGASGVGDGAEEAAKAIGWDFRILDGQGTVPGRSSALTQAIALKPDGIILGTIDAAEQAPIVEQAAAAGIKVVGWHSGAAPGPIKDIPGVFTNITTDPLEVAKASGLYAVVDSDGKANVILFTDSIYAIATAKTNAEKAAVESCKTCKVLEVVDTPIGELSTRMAPLTTALLLKYGKDWTYSIGVNDLYFDFAVPSLQSAGVDAATGYPRQVAAGDGSVAAFQRIRDKQYQVATVAEPLHLHGWQCIDEMNRALAGEKESGYVAHVHLFVNANIDKDGGANNLYDPGNGYKDQYKKIWGVQ